MEKPQPQLVVEYALQNDGFITETEAKNHLGIADLSGVIWQIKTKMSKFRVEPAHLQKKKTSTFGYGKTTIRRYKIKELK